MKPKLKIISILMMASLCLWSCDKSITYPDVSETKTGVYNPGQFIWHELVTPNPKGSMDFYQDLFGWTYTTLGSGATAYYVIHSNGKAIGGIVKLADQYGTRGEWLSSISVPDVDRAVTYNIQKGGKTLYKSTQIKGRGKNALIQDPSGAFLSLLKSENGDPPINLDQSPWLWNELWTTNLEGSLSFYKGLVPVKSELQKNTKVPYYLISNDRSKLSGIMANPVENMRSAWVPYIKINAMGNLIEKAGTHGAKIMLEPNDNIRAGKVAVIQDPYGAPFALQVWNQ